MRPAIHGFRPSTLAAIAGALALFLLLSSSCNPVATTGSATDPPPPLIVVISIDSLRTSRIGAYGYPRPTTPSLDAFARQAHRFTRASSTSSWTKPAMVSLFLGLPVHEHLSVFSLQKTTPILIDGSMEKSAGTKDDKLRALARGMAVPHDHQPFHAGLKGFVKAAFVNNPHLGTAFGFNRSWDEFREYESKNGQQLTAPPPEGKGRAAEIHHDALEFINRHRGQPTYLWIHHNDVHWPYGPIGDHAQLFADEVFSVEEWRQAERSEHRKLVAQAKSNPRAAALMSLLYDCGLRTFDDELGLFFDALRERNLFDPAAILITADHGEEFWEHGEFGHGQTLFTELTSIPLMVKLPTTKASAKTGTVLDEPVSLLDIGPTVLDLAGTSDPALPGASLLPMIREGQRLHRPILSELVRDGYELTLSKGPWKLRVVYSEPSIIEHMNSGGSGALDPAVVELYNVENDPDEKTTLTLSEHRDIVAELQTELDQQLDGLVNYSLRLRQEVESGAASQYTLPFEDDRKNHQRMKRQLEALGYL